MGNGWMGMVTTTYCEIGFASKGRAWVVAGVRFVPLSTHREGCTRVYGHTRGAVQIVVLGDRDIRHDTNVLKTYRKVKITRIIFLLRIYRYFFPRWLLDKHEFY